MEDEVKKEAGEGMEEPKAALGAEAETDTIQQKMREAAEGGRENVHTTTVIIHNLNYIQDNKGVILGDQANLENVTFGGEEKGNAAPEEGAVSQACVTAERERLIQWLSAHYNDFEMAFLIALAVFERSPYIWVYEMAQALFRRMDGDTEEGEGNRQRLKIPNQRRLETAGGKFYQDYIYNHTGRLEETFICFQSAEYAPRVLECVWNEFLFFREPLVGWLEQYISQQNYSKTIKAVCALAQLCRHDFHYFESRVISGLLQKHDYTADFAVAQIMVQAYEEGSYRDNIINLFRYWAGRNDLHESVTALMMCAVRDWPAEQIRRAVEGYLDTVLRTLESGQESEYERQLPMFYAVGKRKAAYFKMTAAVLYDRLMQYNSRKDRYRQKIVGLVFWELLMIDHLESNIDVNREEAHKDMVFVKLCLMKNETAPKVQALWNYLWKNRETHRLLKAFLERYLFQYGGCGQKQIEYLRQFLYSFQETRADRENMDFFLRKISLQSNRPVRTAEKINLRSIRE